MKKIKVTTGVYWVEIPAAKLYVLCGCPADSVKHLMKIGLIATEEKNGVFFETGPNAILLSDISLQQEQFSNLAEFPVLQMLYRQGLILPNHPNNTGEKPLLVGSEDQIRAQVEYIYRGNYGLASAEEIMQAGIPEDTAYDMMRMKRRFAFGNIRKTEELLETRIVRDEAVELRNGVFIQRKGINIYEFKYNGESITVDINLTGKEEYEAPYQLGYHGIRREYFSVIHSGEGDGWDVNRPCMASILTFQGKIYLIDAGPNITHSLRSLGIGVNEIEGIFNTHAHDDHFNGLPILMRADHRIKYFATPLVSSSVMKKLSALLTMKEEVFSNYFDIQHLAFDAWNNIEGLEVKPVLSPHPLETSIFFFRTLWEGGYKTYAHLADITSLKVLEGMIIDEPSKNGISREYYNKNKEVYLTPADLKKIDISGGLIHGNAEDFREDTTERILLSHTALELTNTQKEIGGSAVFGMADVLISSDQDLTKSIAFMNLQTFFPEAPKHELRMLLNCPVEVFNPGTIMIGQGIINEYMFLILSGEAEFIVSDKNIWNRLASGFIVGELSGILGTASHGTYRTLSIVKTLTIPCELYSNFLKRNNLFNDLKENIDRRILLQNSWLFGEMLSCQIKSRIAEQMECSSYSEGQKLPIIPDNLYLLKDGEVEIYSGCKTIETLLPGGFFGTELVLFEASQLLEARATKPSEIYHIQAELLKDIPIVRWKLLATHKKRMKAAVTTF
ncbi:MAG: MBL fold metallo-hydrolase [Syntrophus sp. (in: bacteria)]